jgi:trk system potassium uptake protein TrkH
MAVVDTAWGPWSRLAETLGHPIRVVVIGFAGAIAVGTLLLSLPFAAADGRPADLMTALFTATSAVCVTGLVVVDTGTHWSGFGQGVVLALIQVGGLGVMTLASVLAVLVGRRASARVGMLTEAESRGDSLASDTRGIVGGVVITSLVFELVLAVVLTTRFVASYGIEPGRAAYLGLFHAVSAFNNAGFALWSTSLESFAGDPWVLVPICAAVIAGGLGFPVLRELRRRWRTPRFWSLHTRVTVVFSGLLLVGSTAVLTAMEWTNRATFGRLGADERLLAGFFHAVNTRTSGFNSVPVGEMRPESLLASDVLMFIGGGSAGTAGGIKVTTFVLLGFALWSELRGERQVTAGHRAVPPEVLRQALTVALVGVAAVVAGTWALLRMTDQPLDAVLFEAISAFGTVGLSTGITASLEPPAQLLLAVLMFAGRIGPVTIGAALALRARPRLYAFPEERAVVG